jgi:hypothetical protein
MNARMRTKRPLSRVLAGGTFGLLLLAVVLPGCMLYRLRHETPAAEEGNPRAVGAIENQYVWVQGCVVSGREVQVWLYILAWWAHSLKIATRRRFNLPQVGDLFLRHMSYKKGLCPGPTG